MIGERAAAFVLDSNSEIDFSCPQGKDINA
jgi:hypothetical protein